MREIIAAHLSQRRLSARCDAGLSNRLRVLVSAAALAEISGREFSFVWKPNRACGARFPDLFENTGIPVVETEAASERCIWGYFSGRMYPAFDIASDRRESLELLANNWLFDWKRAAPLLRDCVQRIFLALKPVSSIRAAVDAFEERFFVGRPVMGVHLRRGDFVLHFPQRNNLPAAMKRMDAFLQSYPNGVFFVATDDGGPGWKRGQNVPSQGVLEKLHQRYGERILVFPVRTLLRDSADGVQDALSILLLLRKTVAFIGTRGSSFSELVSFANPVKSDFL